LLEVEYGGGVGRGGGMVMRGGEEGRWRKEEKGSSGRGKGRGRGGKGERREEVE